MDNLICKQFGHDFEIASNPDDMWIVCRRCKHTESISKTREEEAYSKLRNRDYKWKKDKNET